MEPPVLTDEDLFRILSPGETVQVIEEALLASARGELVSPPRHHIPAEGGSLAITAGAETGRYGVVGFFAAFWHPDMSGAHPELRQAAAVFDVTTGALKGVLLGGGVMSLRTGATTAVAIKYLSRVDATRLGILGSGVQARFAAPAAATVRRFGSIKVYSPNKAHRESFSEEMAESHGLPVEPVASAEQAVRDADVLICCTSSATPAFEVDWIKTGACVVNIGAKYQKVCELPLELLDRSGLIVADSFAQVDSPGGPHGRHFLAESPHRDRLVDLAQIVAGNAQGRRSEEEVVLFCSVGLAGTEIALANRALASAVAST